MHVFKKGDKAVIIDGVRDTHNFKIGEEVEILEPDAKNVGEAAPDAVNKKGDKWFVRIENLKPVSSATEQKDMHPIENLHTKRQARDVAEQEYQAALAEVREQLGDNFLLAEVGYDMASGSDWDTSDHRNWMPGDVIECTTDKRHGFTQGMRYVMEGRDEDGDPTFTNDDDEPGMFIRSRSCRFIRRP